MLRLLCSRGFVARRGIKNYFGPGKDRFYCQMAVSERFVSEDDRYLIPTASVSACFQLLEEESYVVTNVVRSSESDYFEVSRFDAEDRASLQSTEMGSGVSFSTAVLGGLTFLAAFGLTSPGFPLGVLVLLIGAVMVTTASLIVYANSAGELSRIRSNNFNEHMKWGNLLSEYGGVVPFLLALSLTFRQVAASPLAVVGVGLMVSAGLLAYELSPFSMTHRYTRGTQGASTRTEGTIGVSSTDGRLRCRYHPLVDEMVAPRKFVVAAVATAAVPIASALSPNEPEWMWTWTLITIGLLAVRAVMCLSDGAGEAQGLPRQMLWRSRR
jgi:hypothetical protein